MHQHYHAIYFAPHLDDAALSCGGQIYQRTQAGERVLIVTITAGDPTITAISDYAQSLHSRWELLTDAVAARRAEDMAACRVLGAHPLHWSLPDCIYRVDPRNQQPYYVSDDDIFGPVHLQELSLVETLATQMGELPSSVQLLAPLTIGLHVDHRLTRLAAERCFGERLVYYEDYPYAQKMGALEQVIAPSDPGWESIVAPLSTDALQAKIEAILAFRSQFSTFFRDRPDLERQVMGYAKQVGGERVWRKRA
jgi:LmbE family N-acetylglucosaminyl deacetylase